ncbi:MAG TPA: S-adenosylmethionine:tRNA ribosyltransferase-isomerase, partial [Chitinophagaceae bacterium]|nr:S-adenosylmethionine:tRNA ribosyltransferase-isomerase [Chitinophagaceae bacterium]
EDYNYSLPEEKIAKYPLAQRDESKLLIYQNGEITENIYRNIASYLPEKSQIIFNNTKVVEARLMFQKNSGGFIEVFCLEPADVYSDVTNAMLKTESVLWKCLIGGASKWKHGMALEKIISTKAGAISLRAEIKERLSDAFIIQLSWDPPHHSFAEILHFAGAVPLPPYLKRDAEAGDSIRYQTIYAKEDGSVAAPTAGLHFTQEIFQQLARKRINTDFVTLHVGAGTFKPVKSETIGEHEMHGEWIEVDRETIESILQAEKIIAVGTTSLRTIETLYWLGVSAPSAVKLELGQWDAYEMNQEKTKEEALTSLLQYMKSNNLSKIITKTQLLIAPGYQLRIADILITNFHQPQSTLLLLIAAIAGKDWRKMYEYALKNDFRFLSYGDGCLIYA